MAHPAAKSSPQGTCPCDDLAVGLKSAQCWSVWYFSCSVVPFSCMGKMHRHYCLPISACCKAVYSAWITVDTQTQIPYATQRRLGVVTCVYFGIQVAPHVTRAAAQAAAGWLSHYPQLLLQAPQVTLPPLEQVMPTSQPPAPHLSCPQPHLSHWTNGGSLPGCQLQRVGPLGPERDWIDCTLRLHTITAPLQQFTSDVCTLTGSRRGVRWQSAGSAAAASVAWQHQPGGSRKPLWQRI